MAFALPGGVKQNLKPYQARLIKEPSPQIINLAPAFSHLNFSAGKG